MTIKDLRELHEYTQEYMAYKINMICNRTIDRGTYKDYETGKISIPQDIAIAIAGIFKVDVNDILKKDITVRYALKDFEETEILDTFK